MDRKRNHTGFLLEDMQKYINKSSNKLNGNDKKYLE